jgi:hypothetical protein
MQLISLSRWAALLTRLLLGCLLWPIAPDLTAIVRGTVGTFDKGHVKSFVIEEESSVQFAFQIIISRQCGGVQPILV